MGCLNSTALFIVYMVGGHTHQFKFPYYLVSTVYGHLGDSNWTFERQASRRSGDKNEALRPE